MKVVPNTIMRPLNNSSLKQNRNWPSSKPAQSSRLSSSRISKKFKQSYAKNIGANGKPNLKKRIKDLTY